MGKEYDNAAITLQRLKFPGRMAVIDASIKANYGIVDMMKVEGFPAFLLYRNGRHVLSYGGLRTESHLVEYMLQKSAPLITRVDKLDEMLHFFSSYFDPLREDVTGDDITDAHYFFVGMMSTKGENAASFDQLEAYHLLMEDVAAHNDNRNIHFLFTGW